MTAESPRENYTAVTTSAEGHEAATDALSPVPAHFPAVWWSPSAGEWFQHDPEHGLMAVGAMGSLADSLPRDAQRLVPVGPLLALLADLNSLAADAATYSEEGAVWVRSSADRLRAVLALLGIDTGEES